jgi:multidrug resistance efflux pump
MLIVLSIYAALIWLIFFQLKLLSWNRTAHVIVGLIGLVIVLVVIGLLNTKTPSGRVTIVAKVNEIAPVVGGVVAKVPVKANQPLDAGTILFELDPRPYQYAVDEAEAALRIAELTRDRKQTVFDKGSGTISKHEMDEARAIYDQAKARLDKSLYDLEQTVVRAPAPGIVSSLGVSVGDQARPLNPVMPFIRNDGLFVVGIFNQNGANAMPAGTLVEIVFDRMPGRIFASEVIELAAGTSAGQIPVGAELLGAADIGSSSDVLVVLAWPDDLDRSIASAGSVGSATAFGPEAGAMGILAKVLLYMKMIGTYL